MRWTLAVGLVVAAALALLPAAAATEQRVILSKGPLVEIGITPTLGCSLEAAGDGVPAVVGGGCGTFVAFGGSLGGPAGEIPKWDPYRTEFTPVSQSAVLGDGSADDPYRIETVVELFGMIEIAETDSYVVGDDFYRTRIEITAADTGEPVDPALWGLTVYHFADCFVGGNDAGYGVRDDATRTAGCREIVDPDTLGPRLLTLEPVTEGAVSDEGTPDGLLSRIGNLGHIGQLPCTACSELIDNAIALEWSQPTVEFLTRLAPVDTPEPAHLSIADASVEEGDDGTTALVFAVTRTGGQGALSVPFEVAAGSATAGADFVAASGAVELAEGQGSAEIAVQVVGDTDDEPDETLEVRLDPPAGAAADRAVATGTILDDDDPPLLAPQADLQVSLEGPDALAAGQAGTYAATVTNAGPDAATEVFLSFTVTGTLSVSPGPGCTALAGVVTCAVGTMAAGSSATRQVTVAAGSDPVGLSVAATAAEDDPAPGDETAQIEIAPVPTADLAIELDAGWPTHVAPGDTAEYTFDVRNDGPDTVPATVVDVWTTGAVTSIPTFVEGGIWTCTLATTGGVHHRCVAGVTPPGLHRKLTVRLSAGSSGGLGIQASLAAEGVSQPTTANDVAQATTMVGWTADLGVAVSAPKIGLITMYGLGGVLATVTVANAGPDALPAATGSISASASGATTGCGQGGCGAPGPLAVGATKQVEIPVIAEEPAVVTLSVSASPGAGFVDPSPSDNWASASILFVRIDADDVTVAEGDAGTTTVTFPLELELPAGVSSLPAGESVSFDLATEALSADAGVDFTPATSQVTFTGTQTTATATVAVAGDTACEADETFRLRVELPGTGVPVAVANATIANDDGECASGSVGPGGSVSTGTSATPADPVETTVTSPQGGAISIAETSGTAPPPTAFRLLGRTVEISAPAATTASPLELTFLLDASLFAGNPLKQLAVFRDGVPIDNCDPAAGTSATPDPCIASATMASGDAKVVVRSSHASEWTFGTAIVDAGRVVAPGLHVESDGESIRGKLKHGRFEARDLVALAIDGRSAWVAGFGRDGRAFVAYVEDDGKKQKDVFRLWIDGQKVVDGRSRSKVLVNPGGRRR